MDTVGLGIFTETGLCIAYDGSPVFNGYLFVFVGVLTGVGGGLMRDILAGNTPYIFVKHIYACASILGAVASMLLWSWMGSTGAMMVGTTIILVARCISARFKLNLPRAKEIV